MGLPRYAPYTRFLPRPARKVSNVPKLKSSYELNVLIYIVPFAILCFKWLLHYFQAIFYPWKLCKKWTILLLFKKIWFIANPSLQSPYVIRTLNAGNSIKISTSIESSNSGIFSSNSGIFSSNSGIFFLVSNFWSVQEIRLTIH